MLGDSLKRRRGRPVQPLKEPPTTRKRWTPSTEFSWLRWLGAAAAMLVISYGVGYLLSTLVLFPRPETAGAGVPVPDLAGRTLSEAQTAIQEAGLRLGTLRAMPSMTTDSGRVLAQAPVPGQELLPGTEVSLGVSAGRPELRVPPVAGLGESTARELLESLGFQVVVRQTRSPEFLAGVVTGVDPPVGTARALPAVVTLLVSTGGPADTAGVFGGRTP